MTDTVRAYNLVTAGNATFSLYSTKLHKHYTYKVKVDKSNRDRFLVHLFFGNENTNIKHYRFIGWFYRDNLTLRPHPDHKSIPQQMLKYFLQFLCDFPTLPVSCKLYPSDRCGRCNRMLTNPESISYGLGPKCRDL